MPAACLLLGYAMPMNGQDSLVVHEKCDAHRVRLHEVLVPTALVGASALAVSNGWLAERKDDVQEVLSAHGAKMMKADDYLQYSQMAAVYGLNLVGIKGKHGFRDLTIILGMSYAVMGVAVNVMKRTFREPRPDTGARNSFPSGHTATAFMGAEFLYREYRDVSPWIGYAGYAVAAATGYLRIYNDRHYLNDVIAGACIGLLSTKLSYWLYPKIFKWHQDGYRTTTIGLPFYSSDGGGMTVCMIF